MILPLADYALPHLLQPLASLRAVLAKRLCEHLASLSLDRLDRALGRVAGAVDLLETVAGADLEKLVADLQVVGDVYRVQRLIAAEGP